MEENGKAYVSVKNRGETIPPDELALIFDASIRPIVPGGGQNRSRVRAIYCQDNSEQPRRGYSGHQPRRTYGICLYPDTEIIR
jgi:hypothetical protein